MVRMASFGQHFRTQSLLRFHEHPLRCPHAESEQKEWCTPARRRPINLNSGNVNQNCTSIDRWSSPLQFLKISQTSAQTGILVHGRPQQAKAWGPSNPGPTVGPTWVKIDLFQSCSSTTWDAQTSVYSPFWACIKLCFPKLNLDLLGCSANCIIPILRLFGHVGALRLRRFGMPDYHARKPCVWEPCVRCARDVK